MTLDVIQYNINSRVVADRVVTSCIIPEQLRAADVVPAEISIIRGTDQEQERLKNSNWADISGLHDVASWRVHTITLTLRYDGVDAEDCYW